MLISLVRDPLEAIVRQSIAATERPPLPGSEARSSASRWVNVLKQHEQWTGPKIVIRYEDLVREPGPVVLRIAAVLRLENCEDRVQQFLDNLEEHYEASLRSYSLSLTQGILSTRHSAQLSQIDKDALKEDIVECSLESPLASRLATEYSNDWP